ncbi:MAG: ATPase domain-containing protein [Gemmatimonadota bacterium]|jgi:CheY-like chemotaxis protein
MSNAMGQVLDPRDKGGTPDEGQTLKILSRDAEEAGKTPSGIEPLDRRFGGLDEGGVYLVSGTPGPAKMVMALQFIREGIRRGERVVLLTDIDQAGLLEVARAWGSPLDEAWQDGRLEIVGFQDDFELRVLRSADPEDALVELESLTPGDVARIAVDPGSMFLQGGGRSLLGKAFLEWARNRPATVCITLSVDSPETLPSSAEWLVHATNGVFLIDRLPNGLFQVGVHRSLPGRDGDDEPVTLQLRPGEGLTEPDQHPSRRFSDRPAGESDRLLLLNLGNAGSSDLEAWAQGAFRTETVVDPLDAVARMQGEGLFGCVLVHAPRHRLREAAQACRAIRPLTAGALVFASDDSIRSTDRVNLLEAGADDCLSGGVDFRELAARIRQAVAAGGKPTSLAEAVSPGVPSMPGGSVAPTVLMEEAQRRGAEKSLSVFGLLHLSSASISPQELGRIVAGEIRDEDGDLVTSAPDGCLVLLQGARGDSAQAFLVRLVARLRDELGSDPALRSTVLTSPSEGGRIESMLGRLPGARGPMVAPTDAEGSGGQGR